MADTVTNINHPSDSAAIAEFMRQYVQPQLITVRGQDGRPETQVLITPKGFDLHGVKRFLDEYLPAPERRKGTATLTDIDSFIAHVNRFKDVDSVIFADSNPTAPKLTAVLDYHRQGSAGAPRFGQHRAVYGFPLSDEWLAWSKTNGIAMGVAEFAEFLESRIGDVRPVPTADELPEGHPFVGSIFAGPSRLLELSRGLQVHVGEQVKQAINLQTGETQVQFISEHRDTEGAPLKVPSAFRIAVPVFRSGAKYEVFARLRYRVKQGQITWFYELHDVARLFDHAFKEACEKARTETALPVYAGTPENA